MILPDRALPLPRLSILATTMAMTMALSACQPRNEAQAPTDNAPAAQMPASSPPAQTPAETAPAPAQGSHAVTGTATYRERIAMPPGSSLRVQLLDNQLADTPRAVLAETTLQDVAGPPFAFRLPYDPARLRAGGQFGLHASLSDADGTLWFVSDTRVPVDPTSNTPVEIPMVRVAGQDEASAGKPTQWQCGESRVGATFDAKAGRVALTIDGRRLSLPLARSASGARYADEVGNEFWTKGDSGTLLLAGEEQRKCSLAEGASPWETARARNVAFRAVGNEPGWVVEVGSGKTPSLHAQLDHGTRKIDVARTQPRKDGPGFTGQTANGMKVELAIERGRCVDTMSGASFEASAQLSVGGNTYRGCGVFLDE